MMWYHLQVPKVMVKISYFPLILYVFMFNLRCGLFEEEWSEHGQSWKWILSSRTILSNIWGCLENLLSSGSLTFYVCTFRIYITFLWWKIRRRKLPAVSWCCTVFGVTSSTSFLVLASWSMLLLATDTVAWYWQLDLDSSWSTLPPLFTWCSTRN